MKRALVSIYSIASVVLSSAVSSASQFITDEEYKSSATFRLQKYEYMMDKAAEDLTENEDFWAAIKAETDAATREGWLSALSRKLPSQPIAVIKLIFRTGTAVDTVCRPLFIEEEFHIVNTWLDNTITTLEAFTMTDPDLEKIRRECLATVAKTPRLSRR